MKISNNILILLLNLSFISCTNEFDNNSRELVNNSLLKEISINLPEIELDSMISTRTLFIMNHTGAKAYWAEGDSIGIFPANGDQVSFSIIDGVETNVATFDGGDWALKTGHSYAAYYPYDKWNIFRNNKTILLDYTGQTQTKNNNSDHLGNYDFLATGQVNPNSEGYLNLFMQRVGSIIMLDLVIPETDIYTSLTLTSSATSFITKAELDISSNDPQLTPIASCSSITLSLDRIKINANDTLHAYIMCAPVDLTDGSLMVSIKGSDTYNTEIISKNLIAGKAYKFNGVFDPNIELINFKDPEVKRICVENWDTNNDGELSTLEAQVVTSLQGAFRKNKKIKSFDELMYFTSLGGDYSSKYIPDDYDFEGCTSLTSICLPYFGSLNNYNITIGWGAFSGCTSLVNVGVPFIVDVIGAYSFYNCNSLNSINIISNKIDRYAFAGCGLSNYDFDAEVNFIGEGAFMNTNLLGIRLGGYNSSNIELEKEIFVGCTDLTTVTILDGISEIPAKTFYNLPNLETVTISEGVKSIGQEAFWGCLKLSYIDLPESLESIEVSAFHGCSYLINISLPNGLKNIGDDAFSNTNLDRITIPENILTIGDYAFSECTNLSSITINATIPPTISSTTFEETNNCPIYVPASSVDAYKAASGWSTYADRIQAI